MSALHDDLQRYFDGAMATDEAARFEQRLADEPTLQEDHAAWGFTRDALRSLVAEEVAAVNLDGLWARIEAALPEGAPEAPAEAAPTPAVIPEGVGARISRWWRSYWTPVLLSAAAAAGVAWFMSGRTAGEDVPGGAVVVEGVQSDGPQTVLISQPTDDEGATIIWLLDKEQDEPDGEAPSPLNEDPI